MDGSSRTPLSARSGGRKRSEARRIRAEQTQRSARRALRDELTELHQLSLDAMRVRGILPPLYGGAHLGPQSESLPLRLDKAAPGETPFILGLALQPAHVEPNVDLALARDLAGYVGRTAPLYKRSRMTFYAAWEGLSPAQGSVGEMAEHIGQERPYAVFPIVGPDYEPELASPSRRIPVHCRGIVLCAENPAMLEAAVWDFRLCLALEHECETVADEGSPAADRTPALSVTDLVAYHDLLVVRALRLYGCTSPLYAQQVQLDVLRDDAGDLHVPLPLKPNVEPVELLANERRRRYADDGALIHLRAEGTPLATFWPQIRASRYFCIRSMYAVIDPDGPDGWRVTRFRERPSLDWLLADDLDRLYRLVHLYSLHECLAVAGLIAGGSRPGDGFYDALAASGASLPRTGQEPADEP